ncbi:anaerobic ribonucleoside-triphosphate reductase activating protein [Bacteroides gallinaceum]|uniref:Anaerobic ribonucleoside-triphosphate reductase-activating protein n=2 Tax=Bacteroidaceae TaxID=815 RepID=A0ABT7X5D8_9BACE|nr:MULTISPECIES: anaerobic ribonucleoside-triphosphate reductase activating protein [Bacteroidaceae]CCZ71609.1 anaerobic ribonucleoside-triphosphate reductase-activating protein [Bacteroides sp. CAG:702]HJD11950.1 anaerobic ribonucleoside-triphosphate reductase activating protein [Candidatus Phocaeicola caecigallinarum]MBD8042113.1 anaerobic ribonucleoside-triphosphate reductase activating protein [Phocaeicola intestinalis]MBM6659953.1 anaerobic ribonucleoside-triphosphate reductase activating 
MLHYLYTYPETIVDGEGIRFSIYLAGCSHRCKGCHNPESWNPSAGFPLTETAIKTMIDQINANPLLDGITFSGGDPFYNPKEFLPVIRKFHEYTKLNIWCYTGYTYETLLADPLRRPILDYIDVLVDGKFEQALYSPYLEFRGSSNQRILKLKDKFNISP